jgi:pyridoxine 5'-phosphate synthase PdxJ
LRARGISKHRTTKVSPFELMYGHKVVLPLKISLNAIRFARQNGLSVDGYHDLMMDNIDEVSDNRMMALKEIEKDKFIITKACNKKVNAMSFQVGDLV